MLLPTKHLLPQDSVLYIGGELLSLVDAHSSVSSLWDAYQESKAAERASASFDWFVLALVFLKTIGLVSLNGGRVIRSL